METYNSLPEDVKLQAIKIVCDLLKINEESFSVELLNGFVFSYNDFTLGVAKK